jgi:hypothetical protein
MKNNRKYTTHTRKCRWVALWGAHCTRHRAEAEATYGGGPCPCCGAHCAASGTTSNTQWEALGRGPGWAREASSEATVSEGSGQQRQIFAK